MKHYCREVAQCLTACDLVKGTNNEMYGLLVCEDEQPMYSLCFELWTGELDELSPCLQRREAESTLIYCGGGIMNNDDDLKSVGCGDVSPTIISGMSHSTGRGEISNSYIYGGEPKAICFEPGIAIRDGKDSRFVDDCSTTLRAKAGDNQQAICFRPGITSRLGRPMETTGVSGTLGHTSGDNTENVMIYNDCGGGAMHAVWDGISPTLRSETKHHEPLVYGRDITGGEISKESMGTLTKSIGVSANRCGGGSIMSVNQQSVYTIDPMASNAMKSANPRSGIHLADVSKCLDTTVPTPQKAQGGQMIAVYDNHPNDSRVTECKGGAVNTISTRAGTGGGNLPFVAKTGVVRRLTPVECERLMGFPDEYTKIPYRGKPAEDCPDSPRYAACGNSMCVNVMRWIGMRIEKYENEKKDKEKKS